MSKKKKIKCYLFYICIFMFMQGCTVGTKEDLDMNEKKFMVSDFTEIEIGMTYDDVVKFMGKPTGSVGFGLVWQTYDLEDGSYIRLFFGNEERLVSMSIVDTKGRIFELKQNK